MANSIQTLRESCIVMFEDMKRNRFFCAFLGLTLIIISIALLALGCYGFYRILDLNPFIAVGLNMVDVLCLFSVAIMGCFGVAILNVAIRYEDPLSSVNEKFAHRVNI